MMCSTASTDVSGPSDTRVDFRQSDSLKKSSVQNLLVVVNPFSGNKKAYEIYSKVVMSFFKKQDVSHEVFVTQRAGHCTEYLAAMKSIVNYSGIVGIGGDGIIAEIVQGLWKNADRQARAIPIGHIPGGSGNGLAMSVLRKSGKKYGLQESVEIVANRKSIGMDLMRVHCGNEKMRGFLTVSIGTISSLDIVSESFRFLGGYRFYIGAIIELWRMNKYSGTLSYLPQDENAELPKLSESLPHKFVHVKGNFNLVLACNTTDCSYNARTAPDAKFDDGFVLLTWVMNASRWTMLKVLLGLDDGSYLKMPEVKSVKTRSFRFIPLEPSRLSRGALTLDGEVLPNLPIQCKVKQAAAKLFCF